MEVEIAQYSGYCFGVKRALKIVEKTLEENSGSGREIYTLGSVIHNPGVMKELTNMGLISVNNPENIKQGSILIIRSHGMSPRVLNGLLQKNIEKI